MSGFSLGASWVSSFQQVLQPENRPRLPYLDTEEGPGVGRSHLNSAVQLGRSNLLLRYGTHPSSLVVQRFIDLASDPQLVKQDGQLWSDRNNRSLLGILSSSLGQL